MLVPVLCRSFRFPAVLVREWEKKVGYNSDNPTYCGFSHITPRILTSFVGDAPIITALSEDETSSAFRFLPVQPSASPPHRPLQQRLEPIFAIQIQLILT